MTARSGHAAAPERFSAAMLSHAGAEMRSAYDRDGFLIIEDFLPAPERDSLRRRAAELVDAFDPAETRTVFSTSDQSHGRDDYFLNSGDGIRFFFEEGAIGADGGLTTDKALALNKIGHALHDRDPVFDAVSRRPDFAGLAAMLGMRAPLLAQSMYIFKQPHIGGEVGWHQDASFIYTQPLSTTGFWLAIDDATPQNGCMTALRGAHRGPLRRRFVRQGRETRMVDIDPAPWPQADPVLLDVPAGSLVVLHGLLPHASGPNHSDIPRHAYAVHLIDAGAEYAPDNWLQRPALPMRGFA